MRLPPFRSLRCEAMVAFPRCDDDALQRADCHGCDQESNSLDLWLGGVYRAR